jgi:hypothetical protein
MANQNEPQDGGADDATQLQVGGPPANIANPPPKPPARPVTLDSFELPPDGGAVAGTSATADPNDTVMGKGVAGAPSGIAPRELSDGGKPPALKWSDATLDDRPGDGGPEYGGG